MEKGTRYGRKMQEEAWQNAEVDALYKLAAAGVKVPRPYICFEGGKAALSKKFREGIPPGREGTAKAFRFLASRGFSIETCRKALGKRSTENEDTEEIQGDP